MSNHRHSSTEEDLSRAGTVHVKFPFKYSNGKQGLLEVLRVGLDAEGELVFPVKDDREQWDCDPDSNLLLDGHPTSMRYGLTMVLGDGTKGEGGYKDLDLEDEFKKLVRSALKAKLTAKKAQVDALRAKQAGKFKRTR